MFNLINVLNVFIGFLGVTSVVFGLTCGLVGLSPTSGVDLSWPIATGLVLGGLGAAVSGVTLLATLWGYYFWR